MELRRTDAVIAGAGVIGAACAFHLARAGLRVLVLERAPAPGAGSTARATGGFRAQYATEINVRLSLLARERLRGPPRSSPRGSTSSPRSPARASRRCATPCARRASTRAIR
jgi:glycine/D-amino acid oxidase-like deaminating enzyme